MQSFQDPILMDGEDYSHQKFAHPSKYVYSFIDEELSASSLTTHSDAGVLTLEDESVSGAVCTADTAISIEERPMNPNAEEVVSVQCTFFLPVR